MDQNAPPPDQSGAPDQGAPPPNAPSDDQGVSDDSNAAADGSANFQTFYDNLSSQGDWVQTDNYGYVWQPSENDPDWAPYTNGHWVYTDEGWTWVAASTEPWGWATYHYGRWVNIDSTGWVWVPGYTWAPAWVSWRYGGGYCGWAPLPPETFVGVDVGGVGFGFHIGGDCDTAYGIGPGYYHFVPVGYIGARDYRSYYVNRNNNFTIINNTRNVTNIVVNNQAGAGRFGRVHTGGPSFAAVNAQARTPVQRMTLTRSNRAGNAQVNGNRLAVFAPRMAVAPGGSTFRPRTVSENLSSVQVNRGTSINQPLAVNGRVRPSGPSEAQVQSAQAAQGRASTAHVATANSRPTQALAQPLSSYQPHAENRNFAPGQTHQAVSHAATAPGARPESSFTGETAPRENTAPHVSQANANTEPRRFDQPTESPSANETRPTATHEQALAVHHETQAVRPEAEQQHEFQTHHAEAQQQRPAAEQPARAPEQRHEDFHPQATQQPSFHPQAQPHPAAQAPHPAAHPQQQHAAGPGGHPGGGGKDDKDKH